MMMADDHEEKDGEETVNPDAVDDALESDWEDEDEAEDADGLGLGEDEEKSAW